MSLALAVTGAPSALAATAPVRAGSRGPITDRSAPRGSEARGLRTPAPAEPMSANGLAGPPCTELEGTAGSPSDSCASPGQRATSSYAIDIHVDTGLLGISEGGLLNAFQNLVIQPAWLALVWAVRSATVVLEWCFSLDPFSAAFSTRLASGLRAVETEVTFPAMAFALACAALLTAYHGIFRRRAAHAIGAASATAAMIVATLAISGQPGATVGAVVNTSDRLAVGAMAAASGALGDDTTLHSALSRLDARLLEDPWCYLEFGDVAWCASSRTIDPSLDRAALAVAAEAVLLAGCRREPHRRPSCRSGAAPLNVADAVRSARTIGELFLAFPAGGESRNDPERSPSLLNELCGETDLSNCAGPTAAQAEFRTASGTWSRLGGLLLIAVGIAGVLAVIAVIAIRLLVATALTILLLIASPAVAVAPAFGDRGRAVFWTWIERLAAAALAKLFYAFVLGALFALLAYTGELVPHHWLADWLLTAGVSWGLFLHRGALRPSDRGGRRDRVLARMSQLAGVTWLMERPLPRQTSDRVSTPIGGPISPRTAGTLATTQVRQPRPPRVVETEVERRSARLRSALVDAQEHRDRRREVSLRSRLARLESDAPTRPRA